MSFRADTTYAGDIRIPIVEAYDSAGKKISKFELFDYTFCNDFPVEGENIGEFLILDSGRVLVKNITLLKASETLIKQDTLRLW